MVRPFGRGLRCDLVGLAKSWVSSGECRNSCWAAAEALAGTEEIAPEKVRGRNSGPVVAAEMRRRSRDWNDRDQRDRVLSDRGRHETDRLGVAIVRKRSRPIGLAIGAVRIDRRVHILLGGSSQNRGSSNRPPANRHSLVDRRQEQRIRRQGDELGRPNNLWRDSHRGNDCDRHVRHDVVRVRNDDPRLVHARTHRAHNRHAHNRHAHIRRAHNTGPKRKSLSEQNRRKAVRQ